jgi:hypothetical protein
MTRADKTRRRLLQRDRTLRGLQTTQAVDLAPLDEGQRWMLFAATNLVGALEAVPALRRVVAYLLCHCGLGLKLQLVAAALKVSPRTLSSLRKTPPAEVLRALRHPGPGKKPKLLPEHVGPLARYLVDHPHAPPAEVLQWLRKRFGVSLERHTLQRFLRRYSLGELQNDSIADRPLFADTPSMAAPLS